MRNNSNSDNVTNNDVIAICNYCLNQGIQRWDHEHSLFWCVVCGYYQGYWRSAPKPRTDCVRNKSASCSQ